MNPEYGIWLAIGATVVIGMTALIAVLMLVVLRDRSLSGYDKAHHHAELSAMRAAYEQQIASLNMQMIATEQRWRDANHLLLSAQNAQEARPPSNRDRKAFLRELGLDSEDLTPNPRLVFVLTPFAVEEQPTYQSIKNVCERVGFVCMRGDEEYVVGELLRHIVRLIATARIVIANVGSRNPNVFYELGIAQALGKQTILVSQMLDDVPFDLQSQQIVLFRDTEQLEARLAESLARVAHATSESSDVYAPVRLSSQRSVMETLRAIRFGMPAVNAPVLCIYVVPERPRRHSIPRSAFGKAPYRPQDLCNFVLAGPNTTRSQTYFWPEGFSWDEPGPDFIEVYDGASLRASQVERATNFRVYTNGIVVYMQRLRDRDADHKPFLYLYMFRDVAEMALVATSRTRDAWAFDPSEALNVGATFVNAQDLRVSLATPELYPANDVGRPVLGGPEKWIPSEPLQVAADELGEQARALADELAADLRSQLL